MVIRLSAYDTEALDLVDPSFIQLLRDIGINEYDESDISDNATESFLIGLADLLLTNIGHTNYSEIKPNVKRLAEDYEIYILDLEVMD